MNHSVNYSGMFDAELVRMRPSCPLCTDELHDNTVLLLGHLRDAGGFVGNVMSLGVERVREMLSTGVVETHWSDTLLPWKQWSFAADYLCVWAPSPLANVIHGLTRDIQRWPDRADAITALIKRFASLDPVARQMAIAGSASALQRLLEASP